VISDLETYHPFRLLFFSGLLLFRARSDEGVVQAVIPLVAGMLKYRATVFVRGTSADHGLDHVDSSSIVNL